MDALVAAAQAELTSLAASLPAGALTVGDHYLDSAGQLAQATTTLRIEPQFHLDSSSQGIQRPALCAALLGR